MIPVAGAMGMVWFSAQAGEPFPEEGRESRAQVLSVRDPEATDAYRPRAEIIKSMVARGITNFTGKATISEAWLSLVSTQDVVGIKVFSSPGASSGTRPAVVAAVVEGLIEAGVPAKKIIVWDRQTTDLRLAGYFDLATRYGVRAAGSAQAGYDEKVFYERPLLGNLVWGDLEFGKKGAGVGRKSFFSKLITRQITKIINITPMLNHNLAGVSGNLYGLAMSSVDNAVRFEADADRLSRAVPEIYAFPELADHVVLNIVDALICQDQSPFSFVIIFNHLREFLFSLIAIFVIPITID
jgi:hypothetical protein